MKSYTKLLPAIVLCLGLLQCGEEGGRESQINVTLSPASPILQTIDRTFDDSSGSGSGELTVKAAWFPLQITIDNNSEETITILNVSWEALQSDNGVRVPVGEGSLPLEDGALVFAQLEAGESFDGSNQTYYPDGISLQDEDDLRVRVRLTLQGIWGAPDDRNAQRLEKTTIFFTR